MEDADIAPSEIIPKV